MLTVTVSLEIVWAPAPLGTTLTFTVPLVVNKLISVLICELMVVVAVRAETRAGAPTLSSTIIDRDKTSRDCNFLTNIFIFFDLHLL